MIYFIKEELAMAYVYTSLNRPNTFPLFPATRKFGELFVKLVPGGSALALLLLEAWKDQAPSLNLKGQEVKVSIK